MRTLFDGSPYGMRGLGGLGNGVFGRPVRLSIGCGDDGECEECRRKRESGMSGDLGCKKCAKKHRRMSGHLGQTRLGDALTETAKEVWNGTLALYGDLIRVLPASAIGVYDDQLRRCQAMVNENSSAAEYYSATQCLRTLYKDIKERKGAQETPSAPRPAAPTDGGFPIVPVAVAGAGILGLVLAVVNLK
jgi:hypothetical protein